MKGSVSQRGSKWYYRFRLNERDPATGKYAWISKGGFDTEREAWKACRDAMREADRGRIVKPSTRTLAQFLGEWLTAVEPSVDATTWRNWSDYGKSYVVPHIGEVRLQQLDEPTLLRLYAKLLARAASNGTTTARCTGTGCNRPHAVRIRLRDRCRNLVALQSMRRVTRCGVFGPALCRNRFRQDWPRRRYAMSMRSCTERSWMRSIGSISSIIPPVA